MEVNEACARLSLASCSWAAPFPLARAPEQSKALRESAQRRSRKPRLTLVNRSPRLVQLSVPHGLSCEMAMKNKWKPKGGCLPQLYSIKYSSIKGAEHRCDPLRRHGDTPWHGPAQPGRGQHACPISDAASGPGDVTHKSHGPTMAATGSASSMALRAFVCTCAHRRPGLPIFRQVRFGQRI